jgi:hypothetical protein
MALTLVSWMGPFVFYDMRLNKYCLPLQLVQVEKLDLILINKNKISPGLANTVLSL